CGRAPEGQQGPQVLHTVSQGLVLHIRAPCPSGPGPTDARVLAPVAAAADRARASRRRSVHRNRTGRTTTMSDSITVVGTVATEPRHVKTDDKLEVTTFRLASAHRRYDRKAQTWV